MSHLSSDDIQAIAKAAVRETLLTIGVDTSDSDEILKLQADFRHLRDWRESVDAVKKKALLTAVGIVVTGAIGYLLLLFGWHR